MKQRSSRPLILAAFFLIMLTLVWLGTPPGKSDPSKESTKKYRGFTKLKHGHHWHLGRRNNSYNNDNNKPKTHFKSESGHDIIKFNGDQGLSDNIQKILSDGVDPVVPRLPIGHVIVNGFAAHPDRVIARLDSDTNVGEIQQFLNENQMELLNDPTQENGIAIIQTPAPHRGPDSGVAVVKQAKILQTSGLFRFAEPDYVLSTEATEPNDEALSNGWLWGLHNTGQMSGISGIDIDALKAWDTTTGSHNVTVAVIDTGIRATHADLKSNLWINTDEVADNDVDDDNDGFIDNIYGMDAINDDGDPFDDNGHGTHVAGTIGANANDGNVHVGVAWKVKLMACKFLDQNGNGYMSGAVRSINFAVSNGARILNCSWGSFGNSQALYDVMKDARDAGIIIVCAAGNSGLNTDTFPHTPSAFDLDNIISVAAVNNRGQLASWSNYGQGSVDLGAPGVSIFSCTANSDTSYSFWSGTSMAAPHVSGSAALMLSDDPDLTVNQLKDRLLNTSKLLESLDGNTVSGGLLNTFNALQGGGDGELEITITSSKDPLKGGQSALLFVRVTDVVPVTGANVYGSAGDTDLVFSDDGDGPDIISNDGIYTSSFEVTNDRTINKISIDITASASDKESARATVDLDVLHVPLNDNYENRFEIRGSTATLWGHNNYGATAEQREPHHYFWKPKCSVWFEWTAPFSGIVYLNTRGSDFDTIMAVYRGNGLNRLRRISRDDDSGGNLTSAVRFWAISGRTYNIAIDGWGGDQGQIRGQLRLTRPWRWSRRR